MQFDFTADDLIASRNYGVAGQPHAAWSQLRKHAPVWRCESSEFPPFYAITRHADIVKISSKPGIFSNSKGPTLISFEQEARRRVTIGLVLAELVKREGVKAEPEQVRAMVQDYAQSYEHPDEVVRWYYQSPDRVREVESVVVENNVVDWVLAKAKVTETPTPFDDLMGKA